MTASERIAVGQALTPSRQLEGTVVTIEDGTIEAVQSRAAAERSPTRTYPDGIAVPGFVDAHIHGYAGDAVSGDPDGLVNIAEGVVETGVTSLFPTTVSAPQDELVAAGAATATAVDRDHDGASIAGLHLEGPHVNDDQRGAQDPAALRDPAVEELQAVADAAEGTLARVTLAPELTGADEFIQAAREQGLVVSAGHSGADFETATTAFDAGISIATHLYNGMIGFHHREPGIIGASLLDDGVTAELITDLQHLHPGAIELALAAKGHEGCMLITDAIAATGLPDGEYSLGEMDVVVEDGTSRLVEDGSLAGSTLTMDAAVRNLVEELGLDLSRAVQMATDIPARAMELDDRGRLEPGLRGDLTILDGDLTVQATIVGGEVVYEREAAREATRQ
ncbi:N-acetylglucosamine-6-phosphate deacetylase [Halorhabdus sp. CBA1104]|uniref:N-acetylglucosamine-6-phosphate deacetylase n=1 Tax=Halorhabdus sp. CBA1104 TaxID=1380432 RepID=UPI0012B27F6D|nr:N-acetylglucosamine-6-phosphate deacetylase [Halorhabdus sp. CBA1104]QGN08026.1 N-acetylglucosamine-6-phosphate deacetylase [Halorhabdus sp. CBA1104]